MESPRADVWRKCFCCCWQSRRTNGMMRSYECNDEMMNELIRATLVTFFLYYNKIIHFFHTP